MASSTTSSDYTTPRDYEQMLIKREETLGEVVAAVAEDAVEEEPDQDHELPLDEESALKDLTENVRDQDDLERDITNQANLMMIEQEDERDKKRIEKVNNKIEKLEGQLRGQRRRLNNTVNNPLMHTRCQEEIERINADITISRQDIADIQQRIDDRHQYDGGDQGQDTASGNKRLPNESQREFLIRTGKITPFSRMPMRGPEGFNGDLTEALMDAEEEEEAVAEVAEPAEHQSHQNLRLPGFADASDCGIGTPDSEFGLRPRKKRKLDVSGPSSRYRKVSPDEDTTDNFTPDLSDQDLDDMDDEERDDDELTTKRTTKKRPSSQAKLQEKIDLSGIDDGNEQMYQSRLTAWVKMRSEARRRALQRQEEPPGDVLSDEDRDDEWFKPCPGVPDHQFDNDLKLPGDIYPALFDYQKTGVQWLGELYNQQVGGIIGDEMGLGKTIQMISFLAGLHYSKKLNNPIIVVAPATVLRQWVNEFHRWWPPLRVSILHSSGSGMLNVSNEGRIEDIEERYGNTDKTPPKSHKAAKRIVDRVVQHGHVLVTTYAGLQTYSDVLIPVNWDYAVLDEGHKIRNPNTAITIHCKELRTANRVILSGTPMQNNLVELWSLFDFVFPMRLGTLVNFRQAFEVPIKIGGYANATNLQVLTATKCAETLKAAISPYLLQRLKVDVASDLPKKSEQVLFCKLTKPQRQAYEMFLSSEEMTSIANGQRNTLYGIDILRKVCNHPDLLDPSLRRKPGYKWGNPNKSGKMQVVKALLDMWKRFGHKTLLFSQGTQMLDIIEDFVKGLDGFNYLRMDGKTSVKDRQSLVDQFNNDPDLHVFLLTTKVGGLGVNLTGANRVIIFDPDWNPSTDVQARERAWRLGQKREVTIYRLMTAGTIEEKIYHRQIFKQFLTNKILKDPKQRQTFQIKDLYDLFTLGGGEDGATETGQMFQGTEVRFNKENVEAGTEKDKALNEGDAVSTEQNDADGQRSTAAEIKIEYGDNDTGVRDLTGVASLEQFRGDPSEDKPSSDEARLMEGIFARSGVQEALEHDKIINGKRKYAPDRMMVEREAKKVAAEAAAELRKAGEAARTIEPGTVTWTGEFGSAGRPVNLYRRGGPSSSSVLAGLANRQGIAQSGSANSSRSATPNANSPATGGKDFLKLIREFLLRHGGSVPTQMLVNHFNRMCQTPQQTAEFKHMLREIASLEQPGNNSRMRGKWVLKDEFK